MPIYAFSCAEGHEFEAFIQSFESSNPSCTTESCGKETERIWKITRHLGSGAFPFKTKNLLPGGREVAITSESHLQKLCKQYGVRHRPDAAYVTQEYRGVDFRTGKQQYHESGAGLPGAWV